MNQKIRLDDVQIDHIRKLARDKRSEFAGISEKTPVANDIFTILEQLNIHLLEFPIQSENDHPAFSAAILCCEDNGDSLVFIGLNTADYFDKQIFAIAHELYHYFTKTGYHLSRSNDPVNTILEAMANRFAAEFLFPASELRSTVLDEFKTPDLNDVPEKALLRFIVRLQCIWWLPYRSLVKRLYEIGAVNETRYDALYEVNERDPDSEYYRIGLAFNDEVFAKLNSKTNRIGTSMKDIDIILRNYEDGLLSEDELVETLKLFAKVPVDFGFDVSVEIDSEFDSFLTKGVTDNYA